MHQSPQKPLARRRDKYPGFDIAESDDRRLYRDNQQPKARKIAMREEREREPRWDRQLMDK
jgi:hypothetical protein